ncbi:MAG: iron-sulfur cluster repair di-iron protein [Chitinophagia bacterium]|jgi:regulator of cell morphogenesis and NO signaling|nr:iron-sulfur cluster repair di-iron protein [Chitinophagia bacterium]
MMENIKEKTLKSIVLAHHEYIPVLEKYSLDFCCKGGKTLNDACADKNIAVDKLLEELELTVASKKPQMPFSEMNAEQLISYILIHHHFYVKTAIPTIHNHLQKVVTKHGSKFPEMEKVLNVFTQVAEELISHMAKEEQILFPRIKSIFSNDSEVQKSHHIGEYIDASISIMEAEHEIAGDLLFAIRALTNHYTAPENACTTHKICLDELKAFEEDLHQHVHLENNILFPLAQQSSNLEMKK